MSFFEKNVDRLDFWLRLCVLADSIFFGGTDVCH